MITKATSDQDLRTVLQFMATKSESEHSIFLHMPELNYIQFESKLRVSEFCPGLQVSN